MGWASGHIERLIRGETISFRPRGDSMPPRIRSGELCTLQPVYTTPVEVNDIVLCRVRGAEYLHIVKAIKDGRFLIGNNRGYNNGWVGASAIFGKLIKVEP